MSKQQSLPFNPIIWPAVPHDFTGDLNLGYYTAEATQRYTWGTRGITWDGKVFKYGRSKDTTLASGIGAQNGATATVAELINSNTTIAIVAGDRSTLVTIANAEGYGAGPVAENELVGAQMVIGHGAMATAETRTVISNTAVPTGGGTTTIYVDAPWAYDHAAGFMELPLNAYGYLITDNSSASVMGIPCRSTGTSDLHIWIQTWGPCWVTPGGADSTPGDTVDDRRLYFVGDGTVNGGTYINASADRGHQLAGFIMDTTQANGAMPMVMLQISI